MELLFLRITLINLHCQHTCEHQINHTIPVMSNSLTCNAWIWICHSIHNQTIFSSFQIYQKSSSLQSPSLFTLPRGGSAWCLFPQPFLWYYYLYANNHTTKAFPTNEPYTLVSSSRRNTNKLVFPQASWYTHATSKHHPPHLIKYFYLLSHCLPSLPSIKNLLRTLP